MRKGAQAVVKQLRDPRELNKTVVVGFSGGARPTAAVSWLAKHHQANVVTVTIDLGQRRTWPSCAITR